VHHVTRFHPSQLEPQPAYADHSVGYRRVSHIDRCVGAIHTGLGTCELAAGGSIDPHVHSYEELVYVVAGSPRLTLDERHGAYLGNMFMVDHQRDVVLHPHDHPVEEAFYMLEGEVVYIAGTA
jgi:quercetin dioxygenase-like cupin family protein